MARKKKLSGLQKPVRLDMKAPKTNQGFLLIVLGAVLIVLTSVIIARMSPYSPTHADVEVAEAVAEWKPSGCVGPAEWEGALPEQCNRGIHSYQIQISERVEPEQNLVAYLRIHGLNGDESLVHIYVNDANTKGFQIVKTVNGKETGWTESQVMEGRMVEVQLPIKANQSGNFRIRVQSPKLNGDSVFVEPLYYRTDTLEPRQTQSCTPGDVELQPKFELTNTKLALEDGLVRLRTMVTQQSRVNYFYIEGYDATDGWVKLGDPLLWESNVMQEVSLGSEGDYSQYQLSGYNSGEVCAESVSLTMPSVHELPRVTLKPGRSKPTIEVPPPGYNL